MKIFLTIFLLLSLNLKAQEDESAPTYQIDDRALLNASPDLGKLNVEMNDLENNLELKSEDDLRLIVDSYEAAPAPVEDEVALEIPQEEALAPEETAPPAQIVENKQNNENHLQDKTTTELSAFKKVEAEAAEAARAEHAAATAARSAPPPADDVSSASMIDGDVMDSSMENATPDQVLNSPMGQEDQIKTGQAAPQKVSTLQHKMTANEAKVFEFPSDKKDSFFPIMELPKKRKIRSH